MLAGSSSRQQHLKHSFPLLRVGEIVECLNEVDIGFTLSEEEILKPSHARVFQLYESVASVLMHQKLATGNGSDVDTNFKVMEILEHPELHRDSLRLLALFKLMLNLLPNIGIEDFGLQDLIKPDAGRYRRILSGLINFIKFREDRSQFFERCMQDSEAAIESAKKLELRNTELNAKVAHIKQIRASQEPSVQKIKEANSKLSNDISGKQKLQKQMNDHIEQAKLENKERSGKLQNIKYSVESTTQEITLLKSRIVHNPEQLKHAIKDMNGSVQSNKRYVSELDDKLRRLAVKLDMMSRVQVDVSSCVKIMKECKQDVTHYSKLNAYGLELREAIEGHQLALRDLSIKKQQASRQVVSCQDRINRLYKHQGAKKRSIESGIEVLQEEYAQVMRERDEVQQKIEENNVIVHDLEIKAMEMEKKVETMREFVVENLRSLFENLEEYQASTEIGFKTGV